MQAARSLGILMSKGKVDNHASNKQEMVNGNINRQVIEEEGKEDTEM